MPGPRALRLAGLASLAALALPTAAVADRVVLANGRVFADVVAVRHDDRVEIRMGGGTLTLPLSQVVAVEASASTLEEYQARARELEADRGAGAEQWLALARWASGLGFEFGAREAALEAAALAPGLAGLEALLPGLGYAFDEGSGRWLPVDEAMRRRGWVEDGGEWIPAELAARRAEERRAREEARRRADEARRLERLTALAEAQAAAQAGAGPAYDPWGYGYGGYGYGYWGVPLYVPVPGPGPRPPHHDRPPGPPARPQAPSPPPGHTTSRPPRG